MSSIKSDDDENFKQRRFTVVGVITSKEFQKSKAYAQKLFHNLPSLYFEPNIRPLLDVEWGEFRNKVRRNIGGRSWKTQKDVAVFIDGDYLGDDDDFVKFVSDHFTFRIREDWTQLGRENLVETIEKSRSFNRDIVYLSIAINNKVIGPLLFILYTNTVPKTARNFLRLCKSKRNGFLGTPIHRIVKNCWVQGGGHSLPRRKLPLENFVVPHDKRGVLSMANGGWHKNNSSQFFINSEAAPWMDRKYVAFGQLVHGDEVLRVIEHSKTWYGKPLDAIRIVAAGEFKIYPKWNNKALMELERYIETRELINFVHKDVTHPKDVDSSMYLCAKMMKNCYALETDLKSYKPFLHLPGYLIVKYLTKEKFGPVEEEEEGSTLSDKGSWGTMTIKSIWRASNFTSSDSSVFSETKSSVSLQGKVIEYMTNVELEPATEASPTKKQQ